MTEKKKGYLAKIALFAAALIWGSSFVVVKSSTEMFGPSTILAVRFSVAFVLLALVFWKRWKKYFNIGVLWRGAVLGALLFTAYLVQTIGIKTTTPAVNAFLSAIYCVLVPFINWIVARKRPNGYNLISAVLCLTGIGFISLTASFGIGFGDAITLVGGVLFGTHMVFVARFTKGRDAIMVTVIQFGTAAVLAILGALMTEQFPPLGSIAPSDWAGLGYLAVLCTAGALLLQNIGQKHTEPSSASLILSLESVFGLIVSVLVGADVLTMRNGIGFFLVFIAIVISETKLAFLKRGKRKSVKPEDAPPCCAAEVTDALMADGETCATADAESSGADDGGNGR